MPIIHCPVKEITKKKNIRSVRKVVFHSTFDKCFRYVTKTIANLTTYSRKPGDYNGTVIFEIDIMKNFARTFCYPQILPKKNEKNRSYYC